MTALTVFADEVWIARVGASDDHHHGVHLIASNSIAGPYLHGWHACSWWGVGKWGTGDKGNIQMRQTACVALHNARVDG